MGLMLGEGGMPRVSFGARGLPVLLRLPGTGGRRSGTGDDMAGLFCLSPGKNSSLGSARVATVSKRDSRPPFVEGAILVRKGAKRVQEDRATPKRVEGEEKRSS